MKKFLSLFTFLLGSLILPLLLVQSVYAQGQDSNLSNFQAGNEVTKEDINALNPLKLFADPQAQQQFTTPGGFITRIMTYAIPLAGIILFVMLVWGGFEMIAGASSTKSRDAGKQRVTAAITGFLLLFASYWIVQVIQLIFNVRILG